MNHIDTVQYNNFVGIDFSHLTKAGGYLVLSLIVILLTACQGGSTVNNTTQPYSIEEVVLTNKLDNNNNPVGSQDKFTRDRWVVCWVKTQGVDAMMGFRWYYETKPKDVLIAEGFAPTTKNRNASSIDNTKAPLPLGKYRVEIYDAIHDTPQEVRHFTIVQHNFEVIPPQPTPVSHQEIENIPVIEVPFAFDETWKVDGKTWEVNEVKIVISAGIPPFLSVVVKVNDMNPLTLSPEQAQLMAKPIAIYALQNNYLKTAQSLQIDGKQYPLDKSIYIVFAKRFNSGGLTDTTYSYRTEFKLSELLTQ